MKQITMTQKRKRTIRKIIKSLSKLADYSAVMGMMLFFGFYAMVGFLTVDKQIERMLCLPFLIIISPFVIKIMIISFLD